METPWSTKIVDQLDCSQRERLTLKAWIWFDRLLWSSTSVATTCFLVAWLA